MSVDSATLHTACSCILSRRSCLAEKKALFTDMRTLTHCDSVGSSGDINNEVRSAALIAVDPLFGPPPQFQGSPLRSI